MNVEALKAKLKNFAKNWDHQTISWNDMTA